VATLLDTTALAVLIHRGRTPALEPLARAAREEIEAGRTLVSSITGVELLLGARGDAGRERLSLLLEALPVVATDRDVAIWAGRMGAHARARGFAIPISDLFIAATSVRLDLPLLTCDGDFVRGKETARMTPHLGQTEQAQTATDGASLWLRLNLHPASLPHA
jgi:predicted nucleic acid-binding protein